MKLLEAYQSLSPVFPNWNTNHLPMMLIALKQLHAPVSLIEESATRYLREKPIADLSDKYHTLSPFDEQYINKTNMYHIQLNEIGRAAVLTEFFTVAKFSLASALYHGMIRLQYALLSDSDLQIAQALAYFELVSTEYEFSGPAFGNADAFKTLETFRKTNSLTLKSTSTMEKLEELATTNGVRNSLFTLFNISSKEEIVLDLFLTQYIKTNDFYTLHVITGFHALISLKQYIKEYDDALEQFFYTAQLFMLINDYKTFNEPPKETAIADFMHRIGELQDAHDVKLLYTITELIKQFDNRKLNQVTTMIFS